MCLTKPKPKNQDIPKFPKSLDSAFFNVISAEAFSRSKPKITS